MALRRLKELQEGLLHQMSRRILVNNQFEQLMIAKRAENPQSVISTIEEYCNEVEATLSQMENALEDPSVEFSHLAASSELVKEKSARIGAVQLDFSSILVIHACGERNKALVSRALYLLKDDFSNIKSHLEAYVVVERRIIIEQNVQAGENI